MNRNEGSEMKKYYVASPNDWDSDAFDNIEVASEKARSVAWSRGRDQGIYELKYVARMPEVVQNIAIEEVK